MYRGVARIFQRGGHTESNIIVMAFSPRNIIGNFLKKGLQRGGGGEVTGTPGPSLRPWCMYSKVSSLMKFHQNTQNYIKYEVLYMKISNSPIGHEVL